MYDPDDLAETRLDARTDDLVLGARSRLGKEPTMVYTDREMTPRDGAPLAWDLIRFAVTFKLGDLDWIADSALKYTGE